MSDVGIPPYDVTREGRQGMPSVCGVSMVTGNGHVVVARRHPSTLEGVGVACRYHDCCHRPSGGWCNTPCKERRYRYDYVIFTRHIGV